MLRKKAVLLLISIIMILVVAGCSGNNSKNAETAAPSSAGSGEGQETGTPEASQNQEPVKLTFYYGMFL